MQQNRQKDGSHNTENIDEKHHIETYNHKERKLFSVHSEVNPEPLMHPLHYNDE